MRWVLGLAFAAPLACTTHETVRTVGGGNNTQDAGGTPGVDVASGGDEVTDVKPAEPADAGGNDPPRTYAVACPAGLEVTAESEPNDHWSSSNAVGLGVSGFCIQGAVACGNDGKDGYGNPGDHFRFELPGDETVTFELRWSKSSDFDLLISSDFESGALDVTFASGIGVPEGGKAALTGGRPYYISTNCWEGEPGDYALVATW